jgi:heme-degrading monooxygenase HmoA
MGGGIRRPPLHSRAYTRCCQMYARIMSFAFPKVEEAAAADVVEQVLPTIRSLDGYRGLVILSDVDRGRIVSLSLWETAEAMDAARMVTEKIEAAETSNREVESEDTSKFRVVAFDLSD